MIAYFGGVAADLALPVQPRLASWDAALHLDQQRLAAYLAVTGEQLLARAVVSAPDPLGLRLEVGLPTGVDLLQGRDLDNYLLPLLLYLTRTTGRTLSSVSGSKSHSELSHVGVAEALRASPSRESRTFEGSTTASAESRLYKQQVRDIVREAKPLPSGPVDRLRLAPRGLATAIGTRTTAASQS